MSHTNSPSNTTPAGTTPTNAIPLSPGEEEEEDMEFTIFQDFDSDSEGGMQLDPPNPPPPFEEFASRELAQVTQEWEEHREGVFRLPSLLPSHSKRK
jgi:hypothetical protein